MLTKEDNELLTNIDRGTPMGEVFRRFWIPAVLGRGACGTGQRSHRDHTPRRIPRRIPRHRRQTPR